MARFCIKSLARFWLFFWVLCFPIVEAVGGNLNAISDGHSITKFDFLQEIHVKLHEKSQNGELATWFASQQEATKASVARPASVEGLTPALQTRSWLFDPSIEVPYDITDAKGNIIAKAGVRFNTLTTAAWRQSLIFYDADNLQQVSWVEELDHQLKGCDKLILTNGSITEQTQKFQKTVYFDQEGRLVHRLGIVHMPVLVQQEGLLLRITEIKL